jgi:glycosyltransferase involved in cell wall biosynthesis
MARLRVLFLIDRAVDDGGAERFAVGLATHLSPERFDVSLCSTRKADPIVVARLTESGVTHSHLGRQSKWDVHRFAGLATLLRRERFDVLHAHKFGSNVWGTLIGRASRVPVVLAHEQTWSYEGDPLRRWLDGHLIARLCTRFVAVSSMDAQRMVSVEGVPVEKIVMIPNAYVPRASGAAGDLRAELGLRSASQLIGAVAVLRPQKALSVLLEAHAHVLTVLPETHLFIAGDGECGPSLVELAGRLGIQDRVHFLGHRRDVDALLGAADVAAISSDYEGTPLVAFECMAHRTPLVATSVGGLLDIVRDGETGVLVPPRDPRALGEALVGVLADPSRGKRLAGAAAARLHEFTIETIAGRFGSLYETLVAEAGRG